ncbi:MmcQ/YjbR family DNA-binding protein [Devosia sp.]|uniref:MmcQ/YjbR family DNA-binding protein n=1 Tax=Devosia sp. TaxID=1871048 RepID=UPI001B1C4D0B|nr:MmcQ/YjbR family DNA-binding protein [Devosia sp.]MBO9588022.1 MmcQ/YjbR family DNA-binding protein [Devosia sp.]
MADSESFTRIALALPGATSGPHFDRTAFKVKRTFATLAADGLSANLKFTPDEQEFKCQLAPEVFQAIDNGWGRQGWTTIWLRAATNEDVAAALEIAHVHAVGAAKKR